MKDCSFTDVVSLTTGKINSSCFLCRKRTEDKGHILFVENISGFDELAESLEGWNVGTVIGYISQDWGYIDLETFVDGMQELVENLGIGRFLIDKSIL